MGEAGVYHLFFAMRYDGVLNGMPGHPVRCLLALLACAYCISAGAFSKLDSSWKTYSNPKLGFCVEYPARWVRSSAFEGDGMYFETGVKKFSLPIGEIDVSIV